jgi:hypothetical protein
MNKIDETLPLLWKQKHPSGRGKEQTKREDQHPAKRTSLKSANTRTKAANQPICSKVQQARASAITQGNYVHIFNRCSFTNPKSGNFFPQKSFVCIEILMLRFEKMEKFTKEN